MRSLYIPMWHWVIVCCDINLLTVIESLLLLLPEALGHLKYQRTRTTGGVVNLVDGLAIVERDNGQQLRDLLRRKELTAGFAGLRGIHIHKKLVGIAKSVNLIILELEVQLRDSLENLLQGLIPVIQSSAQFHTVHIIILEEALKPTLVIDSTIRRHKILESPLQGLVEIVVVLHIFYDIAEKFGGLDEKAQILHRYISANLSHLVGKILITLKTLRLSLVD